MIILFSARAVDFRLCSVILYLTPPVCDKAGIIYGALYSSFKKVLKEIF